MPLTAQEIEKLAEKKLLGTITAEEQAQLDAWIRERYSEDTITWLTNESEEQLKERLWSKITHSTATPVIAIKRNRNWRRYAAAAAVIIAIAGTAYLLNTQSEKGETRNGKSVPYVKQDVAPGSNAPTLTLADGRRITLDTANHGTLAQQGSAKVQKDEKGNIVYMTPLPTHTLIYNTLNVPRGSQVVQLTLADGTKVWLNAETSIRYPVAFVGKERRVEVNGEAYFEVTHDKTKPFIVSASRLDIEVLGTQFNVNTYHDENEKISLVEGSVKIIITTGLNIKPQLLVPGQAYTKGKIIQTNLEEDIAWKNGRFVFNGADITSILRQAARWYDVEIVYEGNLPDEQYMGNISRQKNISELLKILEQTGTVHFSIEDRKVIVRQ